ncbi:unnamed protein product [Phytophthora fragariaefolia]|uniref:Unnamed protein product n=1 Tax=Phytophthora fragariaefolia TaxID=1490495 RepID=A0A9W6WUC0_9STRA|nr:unnamed protein product [Phytophthora fragariaefolia]
MFGFYSTKTPVTKAMEQKSEPKPADKTWTEHFQYLVYVAEKSGCPDALVLQRVCDSATSDTKKAMLLTKLQNDRPDAMRYAWELVAFAIEYEFSPARGAGGGGGAARGESGGRGGNDGRGGQGGRGQGFIARVKSGDSRACWK